MQSLGSSRRVAGTCTRSHAAGERVVRRRLGGATSVVRRLQALWFWCRASSLVAGRLVDDRLSSKGVDDDVQAAGDPG